MELKKYKQNLRIEGDYVLSYNTIVAVINYQFKELEQLDYWSVTIQKHINYVAEELNLILIKK